MKYRSEIDGLRTIAVLPVIFFHSGYSAFSGGYVGVDVFFVISGYLITTIIFRDIEQGRFSLLKFYERRARRILPALLLVVLCCIPVAWFILLQSDMERFARSILAVTTFSSNILFWLESGYFDVDVELKPLLHTWSLAVEEQFYIIFPLFLMAAWRFGRSFVLWTMLAISLVSLALAQWGAFNHPSATFYLLPTRAWELLIGAFVAFHLSGSEHRTCRSTCEVLSAVGLLAIIFAVFAYDAMTPFPSLYAVVPVLGTALVILYARPGTVVHTFLSFAPFVWIGLVSYSLYLWHQPVLAFGRYIFSDVFYDWVPALLVLIFGLAVGTYFTVERPVRFLMSTRTLLFSAVLTTSAALATAAFVLLAPNYAVYANLDEDWRQTSKGLAEISAARADGIFQDVCHYTGRTGLSSKDFIDQWSCTDKGHIEGALDVPIGVAGDSNAADIANSFRQNGLNPANISGAGCSLVPSLMTTNCTQMFAKFIETLNADEQYETLILTNLFTIEEYSSDSVAQMVAFWSEFEGQVVVLLDTPRFHKHFEDLYLGLEPKVDLSYEGLSIADSEVAALEQAGFAVYRRNKLFCAINACEYYGPDGRILISDARGEHLSLHGARLFGQKLLGVLARDQIWGDPRIEIEDKDQSGG